MRNTAIKVIAFSACTGLAGCGGGGGSVPQVLPGDGSFGSLVLQSEQLAAKLNNLEPTSLMPTSGDATYNGVIVIVDDLATSTEGVVGSTTLTANFASETISGSSGNFYSATADVNGNIIGPAVPVAGSLSHFGTDFSGGAVFIGTTGPVELEGVSRFVDGEIFTVFAGPNADMLAGLGADMPAGAITVDALLIAD